MPIPSAEQSGYRLGYADAMMGATKIVSKKYASPNYPPIPKNLTDFDSGAAKKYRKGWAMGFKKGKSDKGQIEAQNRQARGR